MQKRIISTKNAPQAIGPYSQAVQYGDLLFVSGQIPINPESGKIITGSTKVQANKVLENLKNILDASGSSLNNVLRTTIYLTNLEDYSAVNEVYTLFFSDSQPARSTVQVSRLPMDVQIEIDVIAFVNT